jgi:hypothetical protein
MDIRLMLGTAAASALLMAAPAFGQTTWSVSETFTDEAGNELTESAYGQVVASDETTLTIAVACAAEAPDAIATGINECYLEGADGSLFDFGSIGANPGPASASAGGVINAPRQAYKVCVRANAFIGKDSLFLAAPLVCSEQS